MFTSILDAWPSNVKKLSFWILAISHFNLNKVSFNRSWRCEAPAVWVQCRLTYLNPPSSLQHPGIFFLYIIRSVGWSLFLCCYLFPVTSFFSLLLECLLLRFSTVVFACLFRLLLKWLYQFYDHIPLLSNTYHHSFYSILSVPRSLISLVPLNRIKEHISGEWNSHPRQKSSSHCFTTQKQAFLF